MKKSFIVFALIAFLVIGGVSVFAFGPFIKGEGKSQGFDKLGRGQGKFHEGFEGKDAFLSKSIEELGLSEDASEEEVREAMKAKREADSAEQVKRVKVKLGLSEDATEEELQTALEEWREENKDLLMYDRNCGKENHFRGMNGNRFGFNKEELK